MKGSGFLRLSAFALAGAAAALTLSWFDVLPGGWTLRGWVVPHAVREARRQARHSAERLAAFQRENQGAPAGAVVWLGSSTIERFPVREHFPADRHLNRGIGNESAGELLERLERSLPAARPRLAVLYVGSIDFRVLGRRPAAVAAATRAVIGRVRARYDARVPALVIGLLPERGMPPGKVARLAETNALVAAACEELAGAVFVETARPPIALEDGSLNPDLASDRLHLNAQGYARLAAWLQETGLFE